MPNMDTIGQRLQYVRTEQGFTLDQLAKRAGVSKSFLWEVEHDNSGISGKRLLQVANVLGASLDFLLRGESSNQEFEPRPVEIPRELGDLAVELGLTYSQTIAVLGVENSFVAYRGSKRREQKSIEDWRDLYQTVKQYMEDS